MASIPKHDAFFKNLLDRFSVREADFEAFSSFYTGDYENYDNKVYDDLKVCLVHLREFLNDSWWNNRFHFLWKYFSRYEQIIDLGFSVPYLPVRLALQNQLSELPSLLYVENNPYSEKFAREILELLGASASFVTGNLEEKNTWENIAKYTREGKKLFSAFEVIEHLNNREVFWVNLQSFSGSDMMLSLPIGPKIPSHHLALSRAAEAEKYVSQYLEVAEKTIFDGSSQGSKFSIFTAVGAIKPTAAV